MEKAVEINIKKLIFPSQGEAALHDIDLTVAKGDFVAITGGVAAGKSALLHCITGAIPKYHEAFLDGEVKVDGKNVADLSLAEMCRFLGYMTQDPQSQIIDVNVYEDVAFGLGNLCVSREELDQRVKDSLSYVDLAGYERRKTDELSGGQAQRVVLAGVLALEADILILDQPTAELDSKGRRDLYRHLRSLNRDKGVTIIMVMDRSSEVLSCANRVIVMDKGTVIDDCPPNDYEALQNHEAIFSPAPVNTETIVSLRNVSYSYKGGFVGCEDVSLDIGAGEFVAIVGLNGSGKSTLLKILEGLLPAAAGQVKIFQREMNKKTGAELRQKIGFLFQNPDNQIFADTVLKEVSFGLRLRKMDEEIIKERSLTVLAELGLAEYASLHPQTLSRGQRQLLALASILGTDPELIIADEPTSGLNESQSREVMSVLRSLVDRGKTVILVSHDLALAQRFCHRLIAMYNHKIVADFPAVEAEEHEDILREIGLLGENSYE